MKIDKLVIKCNFCHNGFQPYKLRKDGSPTGIRLEMKDGSWLHVCHDCICDEQYYKELLERVNGYAHGKNDLMKGGEIICL